MLVLAPALPAGAAVGAPAAPAEVSGSDIEIVQTPSGGGLPICLPPFLSLRQTVSQTATTFSLRIDVTTRLCAPLEAAAVVYAMPGNGVAWPQTLVERVDFTLQEAGTTVVTFTKRCDPVQFDVITGASPEVIFPFGPFHGPLLFPFDLSTSLQWFGCVDPDCEEYTPTDVAVTPSTATPGTVLTVTGSGVPGSTIEVVLRSPGGTDYPADTSPVVDAEGNWSTTVTVPDDAEDGTWIVAANAENCQTSATTEVEVTGGEVPGGNGTTPPPGDGSPDDAPDVPEVAGEVVVDELPAAAVQAAPEVAGATATPPGAQGTAQAAGLAFTGSGTHVPIALGIALLTVGGLLVLSNRRRRS